jgi:hypothetical protein
MKSVPFTDPPGNSAPTRRRGPEQPLQRAYAGSALQPAPPGIALIAATVWTWRGGRISAAVLGALCLLELISVPFFWAAESRPPLADVLTLLYFGVVSLAGVVASVTTASRRRPAAA